MPPAHCIKFLASSPRVTFLVLLPQAVLPGPMQLARANATRSEPRHSLTKHARRVLLHKDTETSGCPCARRRALSHHDKVIPFLFSQSPDLLGKKMRWNGNGSEPWRRSSTARGAPPHLPHQVLQPLPLAPLGPDPLPSLFRYCIGDIESMGARVGS
jgi:hypothetical protein